jgi:hypothetical protein
MIDIADTPTNTVLTSEGTPHLTINHEAIVDLDSSNAFEGTHINDVKPEPR